MTSWCGAMGRRFPLAYLLLPLIPLGIALVGGTTAPLVLLVPLAAVITSCSTRWTRSALFVTALATVLGALAVGDLDEMLWGLVAVLAVTIAAQNSRSLVQRYRTEAERAGLQARSASVVDVPTRCVNRRGLELVGPPVIFQARRRGDAAYCAVVRLSGYSETATRHGQQAADLVVSGIAEALRGSVRGADVVARTDVAVFHIIGPGRGVSVEELDRRLRMFMFERRSETDDTWHGVLHMGAAVLPPWEEGGLDSLIARADADVDLRVSEERIRRSVTGQVSTR